MKKTDLETLGDTSFEAYGHSRLSTLVTKRVSGMKKPANDSILVDEQDSNSDNCQKENG